VIIEKVKNNVLQTNQVEITSRDVNKNKFVYQIESFTEKVGQSEFCVRSSATSPVVGNSVKLFLFLGFVGHRTAQVLLDQGLDLLVLHRHPDEFRDVEGESLQEQNQADPLVVIEVALVVLVVV
jgi:hypothetical protein